jgi:aspartate kinase
MTMDVIKASQISLRIKNVMNPEGTGTIIYPTTESPEQSPLNSYPPTPGLSPSASPSPPADDARTPRSIFMRTHGYHGEGQERRVPTALTVKDSVSVITVKSFRSARPHLFLDQISSSLRHHDLSVDLISSSMNSLSLAVSTANPSQQLSIEEAVADLEQIGTTSVSRNLSIVSVVGHKMRNMVGVAGMSSTNLTTVKCADLCLDSRDIYGSCEC